ncbi:MAG: hypothetical protein ACXWXR_11480 [Candidatus Limnocylindrales bacterium]
MDAVLPERHADPALEKSAMTVSAFPPTSPTEPNVAATGEDGGYRPGVCNIGGAEIARRRRGGDAGVVATAVLFVTLVAIDAPPTARLLLAIPAAGAASGYLQARLRFCAGFGSRGVFNFGQLGEVVEVRDPEAWSRDRARSRQIGAASLAVGVAVAVVAALLPL